MIDASLTDPGEQLIWQGKPYPARYALRKAAYSFPLGIFFFGFSLFWIYGAYMAGNKATNQLGFAFWMFGIPFVIVGACMVLSPAWYLFRAMTTTYALTDRRAIIDISGLSHAAPASRLIRCRLSKSVLPTKAQGTFSSKKPPHITGWEEALRSATGLSLSRTRRRSDRC